MDIETLHKKLAEMDVLSVAEQDFDGLRAKHGVAWAIDTAGPGIFAARKIASIVRPLLLARAEMNDWEWFRQVRAVRDDVAQELMADRWRYNSALTLQNAINQWESEAMYKFVRLMDRYLV